MPCPNSARRRSATVAFRVSPEQAEHIDHLVAVSGMTKQDYIVAKLTDETVVVRPSTRVYKALRDAMHDVYQELARISAGCPADVRSAALVEILAPEFIGFRGDAPQADVDAEESHIAEMGRER